VPTIPLIDLPDTGSVKTLDLLSLDVERREPKALGGFDINGFPPQLACVEENALVRRLILGDFACHGHVLVGECLQADIDTLDFTPLK
jgi:hypothetical protein